MLADFQPSMPPMLPAMSPPVEAGEFDVPEILGANDWAEVCEAAIEEWQEEAGLEFAHMLGLLRHLHERDQAAGKSRLRHTMTLIRRWEGLRRRLGEGKSREERSFLAGESGLSCLPSPYGPILEFLLFPRHPGGALRPYLGSEDLVRWGLRLGLP